jgi:hypothetical protein
VPWLHEVPEPHKANIYFNTKMKVWKKTRWQKMSMQVGNCQMKNWLHSSMEKPPDVGKPKPNHALLLKSENKRLHCRSHITLKIYYFGKTCWNRPVHTVFVLMFWKAFGYHPTLLNLYCKTSIQSWLFQRPEQYFK